MNYAVSVIVPVFNAQETLGKCLSSLIAQSIPVEILVIDDGSTDYSLEVAQSFARVQPAVRVHRQENAGVSAARNRGLHCATGEYIGFVDPDDSVSPEMYRRLLDATRSENAKVAVLTRHSILPASPADSPARFCIDGSAAASLLLQLRYPTSVWAHLYARDVLGGASFDTEIGFFEDLLFNFEVLRAVQRVALVDGDYYYYEPGRMGANLAPLDDRHLSALIACKKVRQVVADEALSFRAELAVLDVRCLEMILYKAALITPRSRLVIKSIREHSRSVASDCLSSDAVGLLEKLLVLLSAVSPRSVIAASSLAIRTKRALSKYGSETL